VTIGRNHEASGRLSNNKEKSEDAAPQGEGRDLEKGKKVKTCELKKETQLWKIGELALTKKKKALPGTYGGGRTTIKKERLRSKRTGRGIDARGTRDRVATKGG